MINQNLKIINEYEQKYQKEDEIYLVRESDNYIREVLIKNRNKIRRGTKWISTFYEVFGIEFLVELKIRKETSLFTFLVVLITGIVEIAIGVCLCFIPYLSLGMFLLKEGIGDIKKSIEYIQSKTVINLSDWVKAKSFEFLNLYFNLYITRRWINKSSNWKNRIS